VEDSNHSDEQTEETETTVATKKVDNLKAATLPSMLQGTTPVSSGEFSAADDASKKWGGKYMQSDDFTVASEIFEESEKDDQLILEMLAKVGNGESDTFGVKRQNSKRNQPPPTSLEFRDSAGIAARRGTFKSCDEISEDFSVMTIDTRVSKMAPPAEECMSTEFSIASAGWGETVSEEFGAAAMRRRVSKIIAPPAEEYMSTEFSIASAGWDMETVSGEFGTAAMRRRVSKIIAPPAEEYMSTEFSIASAGWDDTVNEDFGTAASRRRDTDKIHDDNDDVAFSTASSRDLDEFDELAADL
jgi:hypothetical protein